MVDDGESAKTAVVDLDFKLLDILLASPVFFAAVPLFLVGSLTLIALGGSVFQGTTFLSELWSLFTDWGTAIVVVAVVGTPSVALSSAWFYLRKLSGQVPGSRIRVSETGITFSGGGMAIEHGWGHIHEIRDRGRFFVVDCVRRNPHIIPKRSILDHPEAQWILDKFEAFDRRSGGAPEPVRGEESGVDIPLETDLRELLFGAVWKMRRVLLFFGVCLLLFLLLPVFVLAALHLGPWQAEMAKPPLSLWAMPGFWALFGVILIPLGALILIWLVYGYLSTRRGIGGSDASVRIDDDGLTWRTADGWTRDSWSLFESVSRPRDWVFLETGLGYVLLDRHDVDPEDWPTLEELLDEKLAD